MTTFFSEKLYDMMKSFPKETFVFEAEEKKLMEYYQNIFRANTIDEFNQRIKEFGTFMVKEKKYKANHKQLEKLRAVRNCPFFLLCCNITLLALLEPEKGIHITKDIWVHTTWNQMLSQNMEADVLPLLYSAPFIAERSQLKEGIDTSQKILEYTKLLDLSNFVETFLIPGAVPKLEHEAFCDTFSVEGGVCHVSAIPKKQFASIYLISTREDIPLEELQKAYMNWLQNLSMYQDLIQQQQNEAAKKETAAKTEKPTGPIETFVQKMDWFHNYESFRLAGCSTLDVLYDREIISGEISPEAGDAAIEDVRGCKDTYGISHENAKIYEIKVGPLELEREESDSNFIPVDTYHIADIQNINNDLFYKSSSNPEIFTELFQIFLQLIQAEKPYALPTKLYKTAFSLIKKCKKETPFQKDSDYEYAYQSMLEEIKEYMDEDSYDDLIALITNTLIRYILKNCEESDAWKEGLKVILSAQLSMLEEAELCYIDTYEFLKIELLQRLGRETDTYGIIRRMEEMNDSSELFYDYMELPAYKKWEQTHVPLHGPDNFHFYPENQPGPIELIPRFSALLALFHNTWKSKTKIVEADSTLQSSEKKYDKEKIYFEKDPWLASYWLIYFGLTKDSRYQEVCNMVSEYHLIKQDKNQIIRPAIDFFAAWKR